MTELLTGLINCAADSGSIESFVARAGEILEKESLSAERIFLSVQTLHPALRARTYLWKKGAAVDVEHWPHGLRNRPGYYSSPDYNVHSRRAEYRVDLSQTIRNSRCDLYGELQAEGFTDYLMVPLHFSDGTVNTFSIATKEPEGFPASGLKIFRGASPLLGIILERYAALETVSSTLETYLGRSARKEVLQGGIKTGEGKLINAVILFADLHDFSRHTRKLGPLDTVRLLNEYFDCLVGPIEEHGGYVLKFIGDAVLAFFPAGEDVAFSQDPLTAVLAIRQRLKDLNAAREDAGEEVLRHGLCLHFGEVLYGNIGSSTRLDFTIIGEAVNVSERVAELTSNLREDYLITGDYVCRFGEQDFRALGSHHLRSATDAIELFTIASGT